MEKFSKIFFFILIALFSVGVVLELLGDIDLPPDTPVEAHSTVYPSHQQMVHSVVNVGQGTSTATTTTM